MLKQMLEYFESSFFSKYQCWFRKGFSAQHRQVSMLTDLSNAFNCLSHGFLIAKLNVYRCNMSALQFIHSYLKNRMQRIKIISEYSSCEDIIFDL